MSLPVRIFDKILNHKKCSEVVKSISTLHIVKFHSIYTRKKIGFFFIINKLFKLLIINNLKYVIFLIEDFFTKKNNNSTEKKNINNFTFHKYQTFKFKRRLLLWKF